MLILILVLGIAHMMTAQFDTLRIAAEIDNIKDQGDHQNFWEEIHELDQKYRGEATVDSIDFDNLLRVCMYYNRFGYPDKKLAGEKSSIISYVWIHNSTPRVGQYAFPIVFSGYLNKVFSQKTLRLYFLRVDYTSKFNDEKHLTDPLGKVLKKLEMSIGPRVDIAKLLSTQKEERSFLNAPHEELGMWIGETRYDTLSYQGKPVINTYEDAPKRIFQDQQGHYYFQKIYQDGSYFPRRLYKDARGRFRFFETSKDYYEILEDHRLRYVDAEGKVTDMRKM